nr:uncharacterized protein CTRU02_05597 [Colletotrichum truncatum]KAF6794040.1 hypothetical protein CTRU02_05597 [Colletotrichum truncatum]
MGIIQSLVVKVGAAYAMKVTLTTMPKLVPAPFIAHSRSFSFSGRTAPAGWCWRASHVSP